MNEILLAYLRFAEKYYYRDGKPDKQIGMIKDAIRVVRNLFGRTPAMEFGPQKLKSVQQALARLAWSRNYVNEQVNRVRRVFKWAVGEELVPGDMYQALQSVPGLRKGTTGVKESKPVKPVPEAVVEATLPFVTPPVATMIRLGLLTGARPGEICALRGIDIEMSGCVWIYRPGSDHGPHGQHKTAHLGKAREIYLGPKAQELLKPWLKLDLTAYLFSPADAEEARNANRKRNRKTPMTPSQAKRKRKAKPKRQKQNRFAVTSYRNAIYRACDQAFPAPAPLSQQKGETRKK